MGFYTYILQCSDETYYVGQTDDLEQRLSQHQSGLGSKYTSKRLPVRLMWVRESETREEAKELERKLKGWRHAKKSALIRGDVGALRGLSKRGRKD